MKQCRRLLEKDLDLPALALDSFKDVVSEEVDRVSRISDGNEINISCVAASVAERQCAWLRRRHPSA